MSTRHEPDAALGAGGADMNKRGKAPDLMEIIF